MRLRSQRWDCIAVLTEGTRPSSCLALDGGGMYLLFLDESGTHGRSPVFIVGGLAVHEQDAWHLQERLESELRRSVPEFVNFVDLELHGSEIRSPKPESGWFGLPFPVRARVLTRSVQALTRYSPVDDDKAPALFAAVVDRAYDDYEERAYEEVLNRFNQMLVRRGYEGGSGLHERGLVIHDRRVVERDIQSQTQMWRRASGRIGRLTHLADVPLFADSYASRLIQAADLVCYSMWRYYGTERSDPQYATVLWPRFDHAEGVVHGLVHVWRGFSRGEACCPACESRRSASDLSRVRPHEPRA